MSEWIYDLSKLNFWAEEFFSTANLSNFQPATFHYREDQTSITIVPEKVEVFNLNSPIAGTIKRVEPGVLKENAAIHRQVIGYIVAEKMAKNKSLFYYHLSLTLNNALLELTKILGPLDFRKITAAQPGSPGIYFREMENYAGIELRLFVERSK